MPGLPLAALSPRAGKRVIQSSMGVRSRAPYVRPYFHVGNTVFFPGQFSLCASLEVMHGAASDARNTLQGTCLVTRLHLGCSGDTLLLPLDGNALPQGE